MAGRSFCAKKTVLHTALLDKKMKAGYAFVGILYGNKYALHEWIQI